MFKKYLFLSFCTILSLYCYPQVKEVVWSPPVKIKGSMSSIGQGSDNLYVTRTYRKSTYLENFNLSDMTLSGSTELNMSLPEMGTVKMSLDAKLIIEDKIVILGSYYQRKLDKNKLYGIVFNTRGEIQSNWREIAEIDASSASNNGGFQVRLSRDTSKLLVAINLPYEQNGKEKFRMLVLDKNLEELWDKSFELPFSDKQTSILNFTLDNDGVAHMFADVAAADRKERKMARKLNEDPNRKFILSFNPNTEEVVEREITLKQKTILYSAFFVDFKGDLIITGFYGDNTNKKSGLSGSFYIRMPRNSRLPQVEETREFDEDFTARLIGKRMTKKGREIPANFRLNQVIEKTDGSIVLIGEQYYMETRCSGNNMVGAGFTGGFSSYGTMGSQSCRYIYHYNSLICVGMDSLGKIAWNQVIYKNSQSEDPSFLSIGVLATEKGINVIFNDSKRNYDETGQRKRDLRSLNIRKSYLVNAFINHQGEITYDIIADNRIEKIYPKPMYSYIINRNTLVILGTSRMKMRLGRISFDE